MDTACTSIFWPSPTCQPGRPPLGRAVPLRETAVTLLWETLVWIICVFPFKNVSSRDRTMRKALVLKCISFSLIGKQSPWAAQELV